MKPSLHILTFLSIWIFVVFLLSTQQSDDIMRRLDLKILSSSSDIGVHTDKNRGASSKNQTPF
jgi:hypothetical protein